MEEADDGLDARGRADRVADGEGVDADGGAVGGRERGVGRVARAGDLGAAMGEAAAGDVLLVGAIADGEAAAGSRRTLLHPVPDLRRAVAGGAGSGVGIVLINGSVDGSLSRGRGDARAASVRLSAVACARHVPKALRRRARDHSTDL